MGAAYLYIFIFNNIKVCTPHLKKKCICTYIYIIEKEREEKKSVKSCEFVVGYKSLFLAVCVCVID